MRWLGWYFISESIRHAKCGGVSDFEGTITIGYSTSDLAFSGGFHVESPVGDLGSILGSKTGGNEFQTAPVLELLAEPVVRMVGNCCHPRGLFPIRTPDASVIARFVFGSKSKMVKRSLTAEEALQVYDVSPSVYDRWSYASKTLVLSMLRVPLKVLVAVAASLVLVMGLRVRGGFRLVRRQRLRLAARQATFQSSAQ